MRLIFPLLSFLIISCKSTLTEPSLLSILKDVPSIEGKAEYLPSPFVTAGNRVYMVGHQDGSFPELGWHIKGEMGGIWNHPIKLMDGFDASITVDGENYDLDKAETFTNYPFANKHSFSIKSVGLRINRLQFVPDDQEGLVVQYEIENLGTDRTLAMSFTGHSDLRPTWLGERTNMIDGKDSLTYSSEIDAWIGKDENNEWYSIFGSSEASLSQTNSDNPYDENGASASLDYEVTIGNDESKILTFFIAGSSESSEKAIANYKQIRENYLSYAEEKKARYTVLVSQSKLTIPDKDLQQTFEWLKYNCDWLVREVPGVGSGMTAGIPDYPWWFGVDSEYALKGYMAIGQDDVVYNTIQLLDSVSNAVNGNGKIIHEMSTNGAVFNPGNINETPQYASLIWEIYRWNGDKSFLEKYFPTVEKGLEWLMSTKDANGNLFPDGFGMMEIHGLNSEMIDVAAYTQRAFADAEKMALALGKEELAESYSKLAEQLKEKINSEFWSEEFQSYADFLGTDKQAIHLIEDAIIRADTLDKPWAVEELEATKASILANPSKELRPFVVHHNWVVNAPMEMGIAEKEKALAALEQAEKYVNPFGVFVTGIDRDASAGSDDGSFQGSKIFSYTGAVMTLPTGVQVIAENNYGNPDKALNYLQRMTRTFSYALPGSMYEVSPDYGMITQAWNIYSFAVPIVQQFFGIQPDAANKRIVVEPQMPTSWEEATLENVAVGENKISIDYELKDSMIGLTITQEKDDWTIEVILPKTDSTPTDAELTEDGSKVRRVFRQKEISI